MNYMGWGGGAACECMIVRRTVLLVSVKRFLRACISYNLFIFIYIGVCKNVMVHPWRTEDNLQRSLPFFFHAGSRDKPKSSSLAGAFTS